MTSCDHPVAPPADGAGPPTRVRAGVVGLLGLAMTASYLTRVSISSATTTIQRDLGVSDAVMGTALSAFFLGYMFFQVPGGWLAARIGARKLLAAIAVLWSLCSVWSGLASSFASLWASRLALGLGQGGLIPGAAFVLQEWVPPKEKGTASSIMAATMSAGSVLATGLTGVLLPVIGWRNAFVVYSLVGIAWALLFYWWFRDRPEKHAGVNAAELRIIADEPVPIKADQPVHGAEPSGVTAFSPKTPPLVALLGSGSLRALCGQAFFRAFSAAFYITWFPAYLEKSRGVKVTEAGLWAMLPPASIIVGALVGGVAVDALFRRTGRRRISRGAVGIATHLFCAASCVAAGMPEELLYMVLLVALGAFFSGFGGPAAWAATLDISAPRTGVVMGIQNMAGNFGAMICPAVVGALIGYIQAERGDWNWVLYLFGGMYFLAALCWLFLNPDQKIFTRENAATAA